MPTHPPEAEVPFVDTVGEYAKRIRAHLAANADRAFTVPELIAATEMSERLVREGVNRLMYEGALRCSSRYTPHKRGQFPREYALKA